MPGAELRKSTTNAPVKEGHKSEPASDWDAWPDGMIKRDFTWQEFEATGELMSHWAAKVGGGDRRGKLSAAVWAMGKRSTRDCLGVIHCDDEDCTYAVRPFTTRPRIARQLENHCEICGASLTHQECAVRAVLWKWSGGVHYEQTETHRHRRPPRILHLSKTERRKFVELVEQHPKTGPRGLIVGVPGLGGPGQSTADISPALLNIDRVAKERLKVKRDYNSANGDDFIASFAKFTTDHAEFVLLEIIGSVTVIALQSPFMASQLVREEKLDQPINGLVNDAVVLILEAPEHSEPNPSPQSQSLPPWDFPATLTPSTIAKNEAKNKGITYDLIGLGFFSESSMHFIARYADKETSQICTYDSMKNKGNAVSEPNAEIATHIAGQVHANIPPTYTPSLAIYHLRGGMEAQQAFFESQTNACARSYPLQFSTYGVPPLSALPNVTYIGQDCPIELKPSGRHRKQEGMKEYVTKMHSINPEYNPPENGRLAPSKTVPPPISLGDGPESEEEIEPLRTPTETTKPLTMVSNPGAQESPPDSPFKIKCRCGFEGDGNMYYDENEGEAVLCTECECWSHVACQKNGRASKLRAKEPFFCDFCQVRAPGMAHLEKYHAAERR